MCFSACDMQIKAVLALPQINKYIVNLCPFILVQLLVYSIDMNNLARYYITKPLKLEFDQLIWFLNVRT